MQFIRRLVSSSAYVFGYGMVLHNALEGGEDLTFDLGSWEADPKVDRTCVRNGIFANTAGYLAAVDQLSAWDIVERFYGGDLMCRLQNSGPSLLRRQSRSERLRHAP